MSARSALERVLFPQTFEIGDALTLLLDEQRGFLALLPLVTFGSLGSGLLASLGRVPGVFGHHLQAFGRHDRRALVLHQQAELVALDGVAQHCQIVALGADLGIPHMHLVPGDGALAATGQANGAGTHVRPRPVRSASWRRNVPAVIGGTIFIEVEAEKTAARTCSRGLIIT